ncbi:MAG: glycoside hydrolase family 3 C-terminal domain-containing protein [Candidatus Symbiothrix sp.]|nr:glycoside hydrolase family 3 C-terminal domain-containing protein [Candidatus Symbiothrix sp.]
MFLPLSLFAQKERVLSAATPLVLNLQDPGDVKGLILETTGLAKQDIPDNIRIYVSYDPMNWGEAVQYTVSGDKKKYTLNFPPKYGAHVQIRTKKSFNLVDWIVVQEEKSQQTTTTADQPWMNADLPVEERIKLLLAAMTPADKMELLREGWGIPGIPYLNIPFMNKVEALHGFSYGSGATVFPQSIALGATWNKQLIEKVAETIGDETLSAHTLQAWSPVLDVAQDPRWGRCEETYGEDPFLVSQMGGAWIKGYQSKGLYTTPKHFAIHGAPLGGRDSHDIGLSEREIREVHLEPFRQAIKTYDCQSVMMAYSDYLGVPVAKSRELLQGILREEWGFNGFIVSDCGAIGNLTARKHYTAKDYVEAANQALAAGIATNCGDVYKNPAVIEAAKDGRIDVKNLDRVCSSLLRVMFGNGLFENNPAKPLDWHTIYPGWNSPEHRELARRASRESIVLLENKNNILPLSKSIANIAVIGPGADDLQPGDYTQALQPEQLKSVLTGIKAAVGKNTKVWYEKGCDFFDKTNYDLEKVLAAIKKSEVVVMVLGDCSTSETMNEMTKTSGENRDLATLLLQGHQQELLEVVCETGKPVILVLQSGRPYDLSYAAEHAAAILVNWLPGQEGGPATADVLFGDYNPAGRLPMTFPQHVGQVPLYYNFKTSGRRYEYTDLSYYPLYRFGYGLSYTQFEYANIQTNIQENGKVIVTAQVTNTGNRAGDEVAQLYVTDMYASVKTRVMELKGFERLSLQPGESKEVTFTLSPYDLSLLNEKMDRVVEPGEFKITVGGKSPSYKAQDRIKDSIGFLTSSEGVNTSIDYPYTFAADFEISFAGIEKNPANTGKNVSVNIRNKGNITDVGKVHLFVNGVQAEEVHHYELDPGQEKTIQFELPPDVSGEIGLVTKYKMISSKL